MDRKIILLLLVLNTPTLFAQEDTLRIRTLTFDSITTRRGVWDFPDASSTYRKVLMHQTLKCDPQTAQDQYACGEWDYLSYCQIHHRTGRLDSAALTHSTFLVGNAAPDSADQLDAVAYDIVQRWERSATLVLGNSETLIPIGSGTAEDQTVFNATNGGSRTQFYFAATELEAAGLLAGEPINQLRLELSDAIGSVRLIVRLRNGEPALGPFAEDDLLTTYDAITTLTDDLRLTFHTPFTWDGTSSIGVDLAVEDPSPGTLATLIATDNIEAVGAQATGQDGFVELNNDFIGADADAFSALGDAITITFRAFGADVLPINTSLIEAFDANDQRVINIHLPWSNGRVYWDAGNTGGSYDRIDKGALTTEIAGQWNNWAFVKNSATGYMRIYLNGVLWHSGSGKTKPMSGITKVRFGASATGGNPYAGLVDDLNIFNGELSAATISAWHTRPVVASHPNYAELLYSYAFNDAVPGPSTVNAADPGTPGWLMGTVRRDRFPATQLRWSEGELTHRPNVTFVQGDHTLVLDSTLVTIERPGSLLSIENFIVEGNSSVPVDTVFGGAGGWYYVIDPEGNRIDSSNATGAIHYNDTLNYFGVPFEVIENYEVGRFITPYGINLDLGPQGFRWTYDVTDYQWLLHDSVELSAGNQQELIDLEFEMITGTPPRTLVNHQRPWGERSSNTYADLDNDVKLPPVTVALHPDAAQWSMRTRLTGHGHNSNTGSYPHCCEWKDNTHYLRANGSQIDQWHIWQTNDCALNAVFPQGGTWPGSREGWCPGDVVKDHTVELTPYVSGNSIELDYDITPVPGSNQGMGGGNYVMNMDLLEFSAPAFAVDAEVLEVLRPSVTDYQRRNNPICYDPVVVLRNAGGSDLTAVTFTYGVSGGAPLTFEWTGLLKHMGTTEVTLPVTEASFWNGDADHIFTVTTSAPNGGTDEHAANDIHRSPFALPEMYDHGIILHYKTNNRPNETSITVRDIDGTLILSRSTHTANTQYIDTLGVGEGCYTFEMLDTGNDGLYYWADAGAGSGYCRLKRPNGLTVKSFESEFGRSIKYAFTIGTGVGIEEARNGLTMEAYPNPSSGSFTLALEGVHGPATMVVTDVMGNILEVRYMELHGSDQQQIDLSAHSSGLYMARIQHGNGSGTLRLMKH